MEKAAEKRKRREGRKLGEDEPEGEAVDQEPLDPKDPYYLAKLFARESE